MSSRHVGSRTRTKRSTVATISISTCICVLACTDERNEPWRAVAARIETTGNPDSTAVLVLSDADLFDRVRSRLPQGFKAVPFRYPDHPRHEGFGALQFRDMYREASAATRRYPDIWVIGLRSNSPAKKRAARFAEAVASSHRSRVLSDTLDTSEGTLNSLDGSTGRVAPRSERR